MRRLLADDGNPEPTLGDVSSGGGHESNAKARIFRVLMKECGDKTIRTLV